MHFQIRGLLFHLKFHRKDLKYNSASAYFGIEGQRPKNIPSDQKKCKETTPCDFVFLNILYNFFKFIFSIPSGTSPSGTIINVFVKGSLPLR